MRSLKSNRKRNCANGAARRPLVAVLIVALLASSVLILSAPALAQEYDWVQVNTDGFGLTTNDFTTSMAVFEGALYAGTDNVNSGTLIYRYDEPGWTGVNTGGFGNASNRRASGMAVYGESLFVGTRMRDADQTASIWEYDGSTWNQNSPGWDSTNRGAESFAVYDGVLYAGTYSTTGSEVWEYDGSAWTQVNEKGFGVADNRIAYSMAVFGEKLYVGVDNSSTGAQVWSYDGSAWTQVISDGFGDGNNESVNTFCVYENRLFAGAYNQADGTEVWEYEPGRATPWQQVNLDGFGDPSNQWTNSMASYSGYLYAGLGNPQADRSTQVWEYDGTGWRQVNANGFGDAETRYSYCMAVHESNLFVGAGGGNDAQVWKNLVPSIAMTMTGPAEAKRGETIYYEFTVVNDGEVALSSVTVTDPLLGSGWSHEVGTLEPGGARTFSAPYIIAGADPDTLVNTATVTGANSMGRVATASSSWSVSVTGKVGGSTTWYLAEGSTGLNDQGAFETWVLVQNPNNEPADVELTFQTPEGKVEGPELTLEANTRESVNVGETVPAEWSVSTIVTSDKPVIAERAVYWNTPTAFRQAAHDSIGVTAPATTWYLAEGSTGGNDQGAFETWVLVQNPNNEPADVELTYQTPKGEVDGPKLTLDANTRESVSVGETVPAEWSVSTMVTSDKPVICERAVYWNTPGAFRQAAHDSIGVTAPARTWYLAEGSTGLNDQGAFETWVLVQNPNNEPADVELTFQTPEGKVEGPELTLEANTRESVNVGETVPAEWSVSTIVTSDKPVIAERAVYWNTPTAFRQAAHDSIGFDR